MKFSKRKPLFATFFLSALFFLNGCSQSDAVFQKNLFAMDTAFSVSVAEKSQSVGTEICSVITEASAMFDCHAENSSVARLNRSGALSDEQGFLSDLMTQTLALEKQYGNDVQLTCRPLTELWKIGNDSAVLPALKDITEALPRINDAFLSVSDNQVTLTHGAAIDLGAVAKGYALDIAADVLKKSDADYAVIDAASAVLLYGKKYENQPFLIAVSDPNGEGILGHLRLMNQAPDDSVFLSTSGDAERFSLIDGKKYGHIFDLTTGYPVETDLASVTVIADNGLLADFLSTLIYMRGSAGLSPFLRTEDFRVLAIDKNGLIYQSDDLPFEVLP